jgi:uncharacterized protein
MRTATFRGAALGILMGLTPVVSGAAQPPIQRAVTVWSDGIPLSGDLWLPAGLGVADRVPGLLLVHGWGGLKSHLNQAYAPAFAALGIAVLTFDYASWGESPGPIVRMAEPVREGQSLEARGDGYYEARHLVDPLLFLENIRDAFAYLLGDAAR